MSRLTTKQRRARKRGRRNPRRVYYGTGELFVGDVRIGTVRDMTVRFNEKAPAAPMPRVYGTAKVRGSITWRP